MTKITKENLAYTRIMLDIFVYYIPPQSLSLTLFPPVTTFVFCSLSHLLIYLGSLYLKIP